MDRREKMLLWELFDAGFQMGLRANVEWKDLSASEISRRTVQRFETLLQEGVK